MGLLGDLGKGAMKLYKDLEKKIDDIDKKIEDNQKFRVFYFPDRTNTTHIIQLMKKWNEIFQRKDFFQNATLLPIDRMILAEDGCGYIADPTNSKEYTKIPGPTYSRSPRNGGVFELKDGGRFVASIRGDSFKHYHFYYKPNKDDDKELFFIVSEGDCGMMKCEEEWVQNRKVLSPHYLSPQYRKFVTELAEKGWRDPPASMYLRYKTSNRSMWSYLTALRYISDDTLALHVGNLIGVDLSNPNAGRLVQHKGTYGKIKTGEDFFGLFSNEEWFQESELDVQAFYQNLLVFSQPIVEQMNYLQDSEKQRQEAIMKKKRQEKEIKQQKEEEERRRQEEQRQKEQQEFENSLDSI